MSFPPPSSSPRRPASLQKWLKHRLKRMPIHTIVIAVTLISIVITVICIYVVAPNWRYGDPLTPDQWAAMEGFGTIVTFAFAVGAGLFFLFEFMEASDSRNLDIYRDIYDKFMGKDQIESRRIIYSQIPDGLTPDELSQFIREHPEIHDHFKSVLNAIDYFGFLADQDWVTEEEMIGWVSPIVVKVWAKIGALVEYEAQQRVTEPDYYESAIQLAADCKKWRERFPTTEESIFSDERI